MDEVVGVYLQGQWPLMNGRGSRCRVTASQLMSASPVISSEWSCATLPPVTAAHGYDVWRNP
jgi:hypothetical protein